jgi:hypothetical protein
VQEAGSVGVGARMNGRGGSSCSGREEVKRRVRLVMARAQRRPGAVGKQLAGQKVRRVGESAGGEADFRGITGTIAGVVKHGESPLAPVLIHISIQDLP